MVSTPLMSRIRPSALVLGGAAMVCLAGSGLVPTSGSTDDPSAVRLVAEVTSSTSAPTSALPITAPASGPGGGPGGSDGSDGSDDSATGGPHGSHGGSSSGSSSGGSTSSGDAAPSGGFTRRIGDTVSAAFAWLGQLFSSTDSGGGAVVHDTQPVAVPRPAQPDTVVQSSANSQNDSRAACTMLQRSGAGQVPQRSDSTRSDTHQAPPDPSTLGFCATRWGAPTDNPTGPLVR